MDTSTPHETYHLDIQTPSGDLRAVGCGIHGIHSHY